MNRVLERVHSRTGYAYASATRSPRVYPLMSSAGLTFEANLWYFLLQNVDDKALAIN